MSHKKWADEQVQILVGLGVDIEEAQRSVNWVLDNLPEGEDPATWIPTGQQLDSPIGEKDIQDARTDWYANDAISPQFKRILDAKLESDNG